MITPVELVLLREAAVCKGSACTALNPVLWQLLPGGSLYSELRLADRGRLQALLSSFETTAREALDGFADLEKVLAASVAYLHAVEREVVTIDLNDLTYQRLLLTLRLLLPPERLGRPVVFAIAGPSGAGKDTVLRRVVEAVSVRGYSAQYVTKYLTRQVRESERSTPPFVRYQVSVTDDEFDSLLVAREVDLPYEFYDKRYGLSHSHLANLTAAKTDLQGEGFPVAFLIMSRYDLMEDLRGIITTLNPNAEILPVLISADPEICLNRLAGRFSTKSYSSHAEFRAAGEDFRVRADQIVRDCEQIRRGAGFHAYWRIVNNKEDGGITAMNELYRYVIKITSPMRVLRQ